MTRLAVAGHTNLDVQLLVKDLPKPGASTPVIERRLAWGGTACNIARHAAGLGVPVRLWSRVGTDFPPDWRTALESDGVDLTHLEAVPGAQTPTCYVLTDLVDRQSYVMDQGPMAQAPENPPALSILKGFGADDWLHISTGEPLSYPALMQAAQDAGVKVAFDPGQELRFLYDTKSFEGLLDLADAFFCNEEEIKVACNFLSYGDPQQFLDHVDTVVVTRGQKGASLYRSGKKTLHANAFLVGRAVDPTGAGDALRSGWYAALHAGKPMEEALRWGQAAAAVKVQHPGAQGHVIRPTDLASLLGSTATA